MNYNLIPPVSFQSIIDLLMRSLTTIIHKVRYFETRALPSGVYLQDVVNDFLAEKGENVIAIMPVMNEALLVHYKE